MSLEFYIIDRNLFDTKVDVITNLPGFTNLSTEVFSEVSIRLVINILREYHDYDWHFGLDFKNESYVVLKCINEFWITIDLKSKMQKLIIEAFLKTVKSIFSDQVEPLTRNSIHFENLIFTKYGDSSLSEGSFDHYIVYDCAVDKIISEKYRIFCHYDYFSEESNKAQDDIFTSIPESLEMAFGEVNLEAKALVIYDVIKDLPSVKYYKLLREKSKESIKLEYKKLIDE